MATVTLGTNATNTLTALAWQPTDAPADFASIRALIKDDLNPAHPIWPGAFTTSGLLYVPNRGVLKILPGDYVGVDAYGFPILVSYKSIADGSTSWTHS